MFQLIKIFDKIFHGKYIKKNIHTFQVINSNGFQHFNNSLFLNLVMLQQNDIF